MRISLNWISDFVDIPAGLDPRDLAERFTRITAEVDDVYEVRICAEGLIAATVASLSPLAEVSRPLSHVALDAGGGRIYRSITAATNIRVGDHVVYAPPGASTKAQGRISRAQVAGVLSEGLILPAEELGMTLAGREAVLLPPYVRPGTELSANLFDDWIIEVDNKSLTHRPDLWGHYGIAREIAAIMGAELKPYPVEAVRDWEDASLPTVPIEIREPRACRRYSGIILDGVTTQPAPLWMQLRLGRVGLRPISVLVDLTNYIMMELGQPMHAFDARRVDRIEVGFGREGGTFTTLDGVERKLPRGALMIQSGGRDVALAGIMGGRETEIAADTRTVLLESANFDAATIRRCAAALGMRTDASARFEKALDPTHTVSAIQRFVGLARAEFKDLRLRSRLSDAYPRPFPEVRIPVRIDRVARTIGRAVDREQVRAVLEAIDFGCEDDGDTLIVEPPTFRATRDVTIEADVIEEVARFLGYNSLTPALPRVGVRRFAPHALHELEQRTLRDLSEAEGFFEIHGYVWHDATRLERLRLAQGACVELRNPIAAGLDRLRRSLMPNMLHALEVNRFHFSELRLMELGSVFEPGDAKDSEYRHFSLLMARRRKQADDELLGQVKGVVERWAWRLLTRSVRFRTPATGAPDWSDPHKTADVWIGEVRAGQVGVLPLTLRRNLDEHLTAWSAGWAELRLNDLANLDPVIETLGRIPPFPQIEVDVTFAVPRTERYESVAGSLSGFTHPLLKRLVFVTSFEDDAVDRRHRRLTVRAVIGDEGRTLTDADTNDFRHAFLVFLRGLGYETAA